MKYENVRIIIIYSVGLVSEDGSVIRFHTKTQEHRWLIYSRCILCGHIGSVFRISAERGIS